MDDLMFLEELLSIPSPSGEEEAVAAYLVEQMTARGFQARLDPAGNVIGRLGDPGAKRSIALLGHTDTVHGQVPVRRCGDALYGRGAVDAKGSLAAFVLAAARIGPRLNGATQVLVIGTVGEEADGRGARHLARTMNAPDCAIVGEPSGWQGVTLGYKGRLSLDYRLTQPGAHSAGEGPGPAETAVEVWNRVAAYARARNNGETRRFYTLDPALRQFSTVSDGLSEGVDMNITLRLPPGVEEEALKRKIKAWCNGADVKFRPGDPPFQAEKNTPLVRAMLRAIRAEGGRPRFKLKTGTSDANVIGPAWGCPLVVYGPGDAALDHTPNEHIEIDEFRRGIDVLTGALETLIDG